MSAYGKFANLNIVDAEHLLLLTRTKLQCRDEAANKVEDGEDDACAGERVAGTREGVSDLVGKLDPVVVEPATRDGADAIKVSNVVTNFRLAELHVTECMSTYAAKKAVRMLPTKPPTA